jgi:FkbM family methyltransferase
LDGARRRQISTVQTIERLAPPSKEKVVKFATQTPLKSFLEITGPAISAVATAPGLRVATTAIEAYFAFLQGKGGQGGRRAHAWEVTAALQCIHRDRPVVIDAGAAQGDWTRTFHDRCPNARILMLEPQPAAQEVIRRKDLSGTTLLPCALGETPGMATLHAPAASAGAMVVASFHKRADSRWKAIEYESFDVQVTTLSEIAAEHDLDFIDFVKMDIEGHELAALRGAAKVLANRGVGAFGFEFGPSNVNSRTMFIDFFELFKAYGFNIFRVRPGGRLLPLPYYDEDCEFYRGTCNYVARLSDHPYNLGRS